MDDQLLSQGPADQLVRELIRTGRAATPDDVRRIIERMATAPFDPGAVRVRVSERGMHYQGRTIGARVDSLTYHLTKRVVLEEQWVDGKTAWQYIADLRAGVKHSDARVVVYARRSGYLAATTTPIARIIVPARQGARPLPKLLVIYSADHGMIVTGYQFSRLEEIGIPQEARWLR